MLKIRLAILILTLLVTGVFGGLLFLYAKGTRIDTKNLSLRENGLLVIKSYPDTAQVFVNGELKAITNTNIFLPPGSYDISIRKEGYLEWKKRIEIKTGEATEQTAHLFKTAASLSAITFSGAFHPAISPDLTKIAYIVPKNEQNVEGVFIIENVNLPLGFSRDPRRITDAQLDEDTFITWSPDGRQILLINREGMFLLNAFEFTPQDRLVNVSLSKEKILDEWKKISQQRLEQEIKKLPDEMQDILKRKASKVIFSPDENLVLYQASSSATIPENLIKPLPGASTQKQEREIKPKRIYVYDIKEDKNFFILEEEKIIFNGFYNYENIAKFKSSNQEFENYKTSLSWYPSSRHLILAQEEKITILDHDGTNQQNIYLGNYISPYVFPTSSLDRLIVLTNLGANQSPANLYSLNIK